MTKTLILCLAGMLCFAACENNNSSTVGSYEKEETSSSEKKDAVKEDHENSKHENIRDVSIDTVKSNDSSLNKKDTGRVFNKKSLKVQAKTTKTESKH